MATELWSIGLVIVAVLMGAAGPILIKKGAHDFSFNPRKLLKNKNLILGILIYVISSFVYIAALRGGELSVLAPIISLSYVAVSILSIRLLNERMGPLKWSGIVFIIIGVSLIGLFQ